MKFRLFSSASLAIVANICLAGVVHAEAADTAAAPAPHDAGQPYQLSDVVVTARKRAAGEALQTAPITASAITGETITKTNAVDLRDMQAMVPAVSFGNSSVKGNANFNIRGVGVSGGVTSDSPAVAIFQDGVYWGANFGALTQLLDLEDVEVLRGPQGTLFGRNVTGGAILMHSAPPKFEESGRVSLGYGNGGSGEGTLVLNHQVSDTVAVRLATMGTTTDGLYHSVVTGGPIGKEQTFVVRPSILFKPTSDLSIIIRGEYYKTNGDATVTRGYAPSTYAGATTTVPFLAGYRTPSDYYSTAESPGFYKGYTNFLAAELNWNVGPGVLTWVNGFRRYQFHTSADADGFPPIYFQSNVLQNQHQTTSELRYAFDLGKYLDLTAGAFYFHQSWDSRSSRITNNGPLVGGNGRESYEDSYAVFAEGDVKLTDQLKVTLGGRYTTDRLAAQLAPNGTCNSALLASWIWSCSPYSAVKTLKESKFTPKAGVSYQATPNNLVYGSYTESLRNGGYGLQGALLGSPFRPEHIKAYEVGAKNDFFDKRLRVNLAAYYYDYTDIQRTALLPDANFGTVQSTFNVARAHVQGVDGSVEALVTPELRVSASYGYVDPKFDQVSGAYLTALQRTNPTLTAGSVQFARTPKNTGSIAATYTHELNDGGEISVRASASYSGSYFYDDANLLIQKAYTTVDADIGYRLPSGRTSINVWGKNLGNAEYSSYGASLGALGQDSFLGRPRTFGIRVTQDF